MRKKSQRPKGESWCSDEDKLKRTKQGKSCVKEASLKRA